MFLAKCKESAKITLGVFDLFIKPFQRVLKYPLLLREALKYTPEGHPDHDGTTEALAKLERTITMINSAKSYSDNLKKILSISAQIVSSTKDVCLVHPNRYFVFEGPLSIVIHGKEPQPRHCILFSDVVRFLVQLHSFSFLTEFLSLSLFFFAKKQVRLLQRESTRKTRSLWSCATSENHSRECSRDERFVLFCSVLFRSVSLCFFPLPPQFFLTSFPTKMTNRIQRHRIRSKSSNETFHLGSLDMTQQPFFKPKQYNRNLIGYRSSKQQWTTSLQSNNNNNRQ